MPADPPSNSDNRQTFRWQINGRLLLLGLLFLPLLVSLGFWQLSRAAEKRLLLDQYQQLSARQPHRLTALDPEHRATLRDYQPLELVGHYHPTRYWLLDNQMFQGQVGYRLLQPFALAQGWVLVDRGWLPGALDRSLPAVQWPREPRRLVGQLLPESDNPLVAGSTRPGDPRIAQVDLAALSAQLDEPLLARVQLKPESDDALLVANQVVNVLPEKHTAYAVQWFCMALALLVLLLCANSNLLAVLGVRSHLPRHQ